VALCVLLKTKEPKIEWHPTQRTPEQLTEYLAKTEYVAEEIHNKRFYNRSGKWCSYCDYLPVCVNDRKKADETLVQITSVNFKASKSWHFFFSIELIPTDSLY
jgi:PD-(D/E)XK nuclease superfamily